MQVIKTQTDLKPGDRIEMHPATDMWMRGDRYGTVTSLGTRIRIHLDKSDRNVYVLPSSILKRV